jgi:small ligand-binding sensory domain FIST
MKWVNAFSSRPSLEAAVGEVVETAQQELSAPADLALVFISASFASEYSRLMALLKERLSVPHLIGCGGGGIIGSNPHVSEATEVEGEPALSLMLAHLPGTYIRSFHITPEQLPDLDGPPDRWVELIGVSPQENPQFILLSDPYFSKVNDLLQGLDFAYPSSAKVGGLASAGSSSRSMSLFYNYKHYQDGTVGFALSGNVVLETIVAQGCRPIGKPYRITEGERNIILGLEELTDLDEGRGGSQTPLKLLRELVQSLNEEDRQLAQSSLFIGLVRNEFKLNLEQGDFLIRNLIGVDPQAGAIAIGDRVRPGQRIQFHLRDAKTSAEDLEMLLQKYQYHANANRTSGALMFSCLGRGEGLYGEPNFDSRLFRRYLKQVPLSGFFCNGEIGPVGGTTFLHGYTSVFGIISELV